MAILMSLMSQDLVSFVDMNCWNQLRSCYLSVEVYAFRCSIHLEQMKTPRIVSLSLGITFETNHGDELGESRQSLMSWMNGIVQKGAFFDCSIGNSGKEVGFESNGSKRYKTFAKVFSHSLNLKQWLITSTIVNSQTSSRKSTLQTVFFKRYLILSSISSRCSWVNAK